MTWLLDTNVVSEFSKPRPAATITEFLSRAPREHLYLSTVTIAEILCGAAAADDAVKRASYLNWLETAVRPYFAQRIVSIEEDVLIRWRMLITQVQKRRLKLPVPDSLIGAAALARNLTVATRNARDFIPLGIPVFNPWTGENFNRTA